MSYSSIVHCTAVVRVETRLIIFTTCCTFTVYTTWQARCVTTPIYGKPFVTKIKLLRRHIVSLYGHHTTIYKEQRAQIRLMWAPFDFGLYGHYIRINSKASMGV